MFDVNSVLPIAGAAVGGYFGGSTGAMIGSSLGGALGGSRIAGQGTSRAQGMSREAQAQAIAAQQAGLSGSLEQLSAYRGAGERALGRQEQMAGADRYQQLNLPEYQQQGLNVEIPPELAAQYDIEREDADKYASRLGATRGNLFSGAAMELAANQRRRIGARQSAEGYKAGLERSILERGERRFGYGAQRENVMAQEGQRRYYDESQYGRLSDLSRMGYGAAGQGAQAELATGQGIANLYAGGGQQRAEMELGKTQANMDILGNITETIGGGLASYYSQPQQNVTQPSTYGGGAGGGMTSSGGNIFDPESLKIGY